MTLLKVTEIHTHLAISSLQPTNFVTTAYPEQSSNQVKFFYKHKDRNCSCWNIHNKCI